MFKSIIAVLTVALLADVCGYHPVGKGKGFPPDIKVLAIPIFKNSSLKYRVEQRFTRAVMEEILRRNKDIKITNQVEGADAVLNGDIWDFRAGGTILDQQGRTRVWDVTIRTTVTLKDIRTRKILYSNPRMIFEGEYELSEDPQSFFNEENPAVERIAKDFAQSLISTILVGQ